MKRDLVRRRERDVERGDEVMYGCGEDIDGWAWGRGGVLERRLCWTRNVRVRDSERVGWK